MTDTEIKPHNAREILTEALGTIEATYWITGQEFNFAVVDVWDDLDKAVDVKVDNDAFAMSAFHQDDNKAKVIGVCSIGALALANVTLYDEPLTSWDQISERDLESWKAGAALAMTIYDRNPDRFESNTSPGEIIATWNDYDGRTRNQVVEMFAAALEHPLLTSEVPYTISAANSWGGTFNSGLWFANEAAARAFLDTESELRTVFQQETDNDELVWMPAPITHNTLATA